MNMKKETREFVRYTIACHPWLLTYIALVVTTVLVLQVMGLG